MTIASLLLALIVTTAADTSNGEPVLLDFHASWCGPCREMRPEVAKLVRKGYPIQSVDFDRSQDLVEKYHVTAVPTFIVVDPDGRELARTQGLRPATDLANLYNNATTKLAARDDVRPTTIPAAADPAANEGQPAADDRPANPLPWQTVVRIKMHLSSREWGFGSGTIIYSDASESIILTCAHIFKDSQGNAPSSPKNFRTKISVDLFDGKITNPRHAQLQCSEKDIVGEAIDYDFVNDVGLIRIRPGRPLPASRVVPASWKPQRDMKMYSVGCSHGQDATAWDTKILDPKVPMNIGNRSFFEMKCQTQPAEGRSGGGLYTTDGYVAGVCDFADPGEHVGLYAVPTAIHKMLDRNQMMALYKAPTEAGNRMLAANSGNRTKVRAQNPDDVEASATEVQKNFVIPSPEQLHIPTPEVKVASNPRRSRTRQNADDADTSMAASAPSGRRPGRDVGDAIDPGAKAGTAQLTDLAMEPSAESVILDMPDLKAVAPKTEADVPAPRASSGKWRGVHSTRRGPDSN